MSQPPPPATDQPQVTDSTPTDLPQAVNRPIGADLSVYLMEPSSVLGRKRGLRGRFAHEFNNGKAPRRGLSHVNASALELTPMYDTLIRTRRKRVLQRMEPAPASVERRSTSVPISRCEAQKTRSSTVGPPTFKGSLTPNREENFTPGPSTPGPSPAGPSTAGPSTAGPSTAGPFESSPTTANPSIDQIIYVVQVVYAHFHGLSTLMSHEDASTLWNDMVDTERAEIFQYYHQNFTEPVGSQAGAQVKNAYQAQPPTDRVVLPSEPPALANNALTQEEIVEAIKVVFARQSSAFLDDEEAWALWMKWNTDERHEFLGLYEEACATPTAMEQDPHEDGQRLPVVTEARLPSPARRPDGENNPLPEVRPDRLVQQTPLPQPLSHFPPSASQAHVSPAAQYNHPHIQSSSFQQGPSQAHQVQQVHRQFPSRPPTVVPTRPQQLHPQPPHQQREVARPLPPPPTFQAHGPPPHLPPQYNHSQHYVPDTSYQQGPSQAHQVQQVHRQFPSRPPTVVPTRPQQLHPQPPHQQREVARPLPPPPAFQAHAGPPPHLPPQYNHSQHYVPDTSYQPGPPQAPPVNSQFPSRPPTIPGAGYPGPAPPQQRSRHELFDTVHPAFRTQPPSHQTLFGYSPRLSPHETTNPPFLQADSLWSRPGEGSITPSSAPTQLYHPTPSRPGPSTAHLGERTTSSRSSQSTPTYDMDRLTEETVTQRTTSFNDFDYDMGEGTPGDLSAGAKDGFHKPDKGKSRAADSYANNFDREGSTATNMEDTTVRLNQRPERTDVPQFVNSDGTLLVINELQGLRDVVHESTQAQKEFSKEFRLFRDMYRKSSAEVPLGEKRHFQAPQTVQQRKLNDKSLRSIMREKRVDEKVRRLRGQSRGQSQYNGGEADDEADDEANDEDGEADDENGGDGGGLRDLLREKGDFDRLKVRVRHSLTSFLGVYDWSAVADQYPTLTAQELKDYKERKESVVPTIWKNFRPDFHLPWKRHPFNKENRDVFIDKFLARVEGGAYFKNPTPKEMLTRDCVGFVLDNHMKYCRDRWRRSLRPLSPETLVKLAKSAAQRSRRRTLHESREVLVVRRGYSKHRLLMRLLDPCNMSGDETDGDEKTADSKYRIVVSRWQSEELRNFLWTIDGFYRADWGHPPHRRAMGGNRPRQRVLREGYSEDGIAPVGLWRNCYDKDWLEEQPSYVVRELEIVDEDYDFSIPAPPPPPQHNA